MLAGAVWFRSTVSKFVPVDVDKGRMICSQLELQYVGVPTVKFAVPFRLPVTVEAILATGNCVFLSVLYGIGAISKDHGKLRQAVFSHMEEERIKSSVRAIYRESFDECVRHRSSEVDVEHNVCGIVIHALASLLGVDILIHLLAEDNKLEWIIVLASLQQRIWISHQVELRWLNSHVDFITKYK